MNTKQLPDVLLLLLMCIFGLCLSVQSHATEVTNQQSDEVKKKADEKKKEVEPMQAEGSDSEAKKVKNDKPDQAKPDFKMQELAQLSSPFTKERVITLNAIVRKSLNIINDYDGLRRSFEKSKETATVKSKDQFRKKLKEFSQKAANVRKEMAAAKKDLLESGEKFNKPIFAGMVKFVSDVDNEIRRKIKKMEKTQRKIAGEETTEAPKDDQSKKEMNEVTPQIPDKKIEKDKNKKAG